MASNQDNDKSIEKFLGSFHALGKALKEEDIQIKFNPDTTDWTEFIDRVENTVEASYSQSDKTKQRLLGLVSKLKESSKNVTNLISNETKSLLNTFYRVPDVDFDPVKDQIEHTLKMVNTLEGIIFEQSRLTPTLIPQCEDKLDQVKRIRSVLAQLGIKDVAGLDSVQVDSLEPGALRLLFEEANKLENEVASIVKTNRIHKDALEALASPKSNITKMLPLLGAFKDVWSGFSDLQASGKGLSSLSGHLLALTSKSLYTIAVEAELRRIKKEATASDAGPVKNQALQTKSVLDKILGGLVSNYNKLDTSMKLLGKSASTTLFIFELLLQGLNYVAEANKSIVELFGGHELMYGV